MRRTVFSIVFFVFLLGTGAVAQPSVSLRGNVGAAFFQSPEGLNDVLNPGTNLGAGVGIQLYEGLEIVVQGSYDRFTFNEENYAIAPGSEASVQEGVDTEGGDLNVVNGTIGLRYTLQNRGDAHPYVSGGIGRYRTLFERGIVRQTGETLSRIVTTRRGYHLAAGAAFQVNETYSFFFEPRYVIINTANTEVSRNSSTRYVTIRLGLELDL